MIYLTWQWTTSRLLPEGGDAQDLHVDSLTLDGADSEQYEAAAEATEHPVEDGAAITDHVRPSLRTLLLDAVVSTAPSDPVLAADPHRVETVRATLARLVAEARELSIETGAGTYDGYLLLSAAEVRDGQAGSAGRWKLSFREVRRVAVQTTTAPSPRVERGRRPAAADQDGPRSALPDAVRRALDNPGEADLDSLGEAVLALIPGGGA